MSMIAGGLWTPRPAVADQPAYNWSGVYIGAHMGGAIDYSEFSNPYGPTLFGDTVRSPGPFGGLQIGTNYQSGLAVFGLQADVSGASMHGTFTCMQPERSVPGPPPAANFIGGAFGATCQSEPDWFGTLTGRAGVALGPQGRILLYGKGGLAWMHNSINMAVDNITAGDEGPNNERSKSNFTQLGWTLGAGGEVALTGRWSLGLEYDYLHFGNHNVATPPAGPISDPGLPGIAGSTSPDGRTASVSQDVHAVKIALNYRLYDFGAPPTLDELAANVQAVRVPGYETEVGGRYVYGWTRFQKDLGNSDMGLPVNNSRLTWDKMTTSSGELFGRIDTPENIVVKGFLGMGRGDQGHINDEDWGNRVPDPPAPATLVTGYSNTDSATTEKIRYFTIDVGYDVLRAPNYKLTPFIGYSYFRYMLSAFGCTNLTLSPPADCLPADASNRQLFLQEKDSWISWRLGTSAELRLTPWLRITGDFAYLPIVSFGGMDFHPLRTKEPSQWSPANGSGSGVQLEGVVSYGVTPEFSVGVGGRYWAMQGPGKTQLFSRFPEQLVDFQVEQTAVLVQGSYKFAGAE